MAKANFVQGLAKRASQAIAEASPTIKQKVLDYVAKGTRNQVNTVDAVATYAGTNKGTLAMVTRGAVSAGIHPDRIFTEDIIGGMRDAQLIQLRQSMKDMFNKMYGPVDAKSAYQASASPDKSRERILAAALGRVRGLFGGDSMSDKKLQEIHVSLKMFLECSEEQIASLLADAASHRPSRF